MGYGQLSRYTPAQTDRTTAVINCILCAAPVRDNSQHDQLTPDMCSYLLANTCDSLADSNAAWVM
jgi:hypothetical protein